MTYSGLLTLIHDNPLGVAARTVRGVFSTCETVHFVGLCILFGAILVFDLRMLGVLRTGSYRSALKYNHLAAFGLGLNFVSGFVLFSSDPIKYTTNPAFQLKMGLLVLALLNVLWFEVVERRKFHILDDGAVAGAGARIGAALSLLLWTCVLVLGRWLPVTAIVQGG